MVSLFNQAFGGGVQIGNNLNAIRQQRADRQRLKEIAGLVGSGDYRGAGMGAIELGKVGQGVNLMNIPAQREAEAAQAQAAQEKMLYERGIDERDFDLSQRKFQLSVDKFNRPAPLKPGTNVGKIRADVAAGIITKEQGEALIRNAKISRAKEGR